MKLNKLMVYFATVVVVLGAIGLLIQKKMSTDRPHPDFVYEDRYFNDVKKVFDGRCVACHACYNSPCQLNFTSYEGILRGASQMDPYDFPLVEANPSTRLGIDAKDTEGWRKLGFFPVVNHTQKEKVDNIEDSLLLQLIHAAPEKVNTSKTYSPEESRICPSQTVDAKYLAKHSMPFGLPKLTAQELSTITSWVLAGAKGPAEKAREYIKNPYSKAIQKDIAQWEMVLNKKDFKHQLSARYLYEHLFSAHINFQNDGNEFFRLVRARDLEGYPDEIATTRPFDDPKTQDFYYRFKKVEETIVHKAHTVFILNDHKLKRYKADFLDSVWDHVEGTTLPGYGDAAANAFLVFKPIPVESRYRFFLENARYFIMTFMKGPVCRGQTALNVINDHFWVMFVDPSSDITVVNKEYFKQAGHLLSPPASQDKRVDLFNKAKENRWQAAVFKEKKMAESGMRLGPDSIWNGYEGQQDPNALLTVYRHFDSSNVLYGARGTIPKTVWVMDYQIFEDIYYNLVAGYNMFGPVLHQINTRLYMDISRIESEDMFLSFMPQDQRQKMRREWAKPSPPKEDAIAEKIMAKLEKDFLSKVKFDYKYAGGDMPTTFQSQTSDPKSEFLKLLAEEKFSSDYFYKSPSLRAQADKESARVDLDGFAVAEDTHKALSSINGVKKDFIAFFPDVAFLRLTNDAGEAKTFTLVRNKFHYNVSMMFFEDQRRNPQKDTLDVLPLYAASYPNYFFNLNEVSLKNLVEELHAGTNAKDFCATIKKYGVNREQMNFWQVYDQLNEDFKKRDPIHSGLFDLNRYQDACQWPVN